MTQQIWALSLFNCEVMLGEDDSYPMYEEELLAASTDLDAIMREMATHQRVYSNTPLILQSELTDADRRGLEPYTLIVHQLRTV